MTAITDPQSPPADTGAELHVRVAVVGAGLAGIAAAVKLRQAGITDYVVLEKADRVGGTWRDNTYPGCGCDIPSPVYSCSFNPNPRWRTNFALQPEILSYIESTVDTFGLLPKIRLSTELIEAERLSSDNGGSWTPPAAGTWLSTSSSRPARSPS